MQYIHFVLNDLT